MYACRRHMVHLFQIQNVVYVDDNNALIVRMIVHVLTNNLYRQQAAPWLRGSDLFLVVFAW